MPRFFDSLGQSRHHPHNKPDHSRLACRIDATAQCETRVGSLNAGTERRVSIAGALPLSGLADCIWAIGSI